MNQQVDRPKILLIGEPLMDITRPVSISQKIRGVYEHSEPIVYECRRAAWNCVGGCLFMGRFLQHFAEVQVLLPWPERDSWTICGGPIAEIIRRTKKDEIGQKRLFTIERTWGMDIEGDQRPRLPQLGSLLRIDTPTAPEILNVEEELCDQAQKIIQGVMQEDKPLTILLADYDLGLFTPRLLNRLWRVLSIPSHRVRFIVYARRQWTKYAETLPDCSIVADLKQTVAGLVDPDDRCDEEDHRENPFYCIFQNYPKVHEFVSVDRHNTRIARRLASQQHFFHWTKESEHHMLTTPIGARALIAASLCFLDTDNSVEAWLHFAHSAAAHSGGILTGDLTSEHRKLLGVDLHTLQVSCYTASMPFSLPGPNRHCHDCDKTKRRSQQAKGQAVDYIRHELLSRLVRIKEHAEFATDSLAKTDSGLNVKPVIDPLMTKIIHFSDLAERLTRNLLSIALETPPPPEGLNVLSLVDEAVKELAFTPGQVRPIKMGVDLPTVFADRALMLAVLVNVLENARATVSAAGGSIEISLSYAGTRHGVLIAVNDSGRGFSPALLDSISVRSFAAVSNKPEHELHGHGLALVYWIIEGLYHGEVTCSNNSSLAQGGGLVSIYIPCGKEKTEI